MEHVAGHEIKELNWNRIALEFGVRIILKNGSFHRYGGFHDYDFEKLSKFCQTNFGVELKQKDISLKGHNWGVAQFDGALMSFDNDRSTIFELPLNKVSHCTSAKTEVTLQFHQNDDAPVSLVEMRFHIPPQAGGGTAEDPVQAFRDAVLNKASIIQVTGESIATFQELHCVTPRGRYDIKIFPTFIQLHGKTFDYKIPLTTIQRIFRLAHRDNRQVYIVLSLDPPITSGQTRYHYLILLLNQEEEVQMELGLTKEEIEEKYAGRLEKSMSGTTVDVLSQLLKVLVGRKLTMPAIQGPDNSIPCSYKTARGHLYPLERGFIYVHKPALHIRFDELATINFARSGGATRSFDFEVETKSGVVHTFSAIEKEEYSKLYDFVRSKNLRVKNRGTEKNASNDQIDDDLIDSDLEGEQDAYLHRVKSEGKMRQQDDDDDESDDDDFNPGEESDVAEEYDSHASYSSEGSGDESDDGAQSKRKPAKKSNDNNDEEMNSEVDSDAEPKKARKAKKEKKQKAKKSKESRTKKAGKKVKDDNRPKRPMSAYFLWLNANRAKLQEQYKGLGLTELTKKAGEVWKEMTNDDKIKWQEEAVKRKKKYDEEMAVYNATGGAASSPVKSKAKSGKKSGSSPSKSKSPIASSSGAFKSREYIEDSDSSSMSGSEDGKKKSKKAKKEKPQSNGRRKEDVKMKAESDLDELPSDEEEASDSEDASDDSSDSD